MSARLLLCALLAVLCAGRGAAQDLADSRARWERMSEPERALLRQRFAQLSGLAPEERRALEELAQKLKEREQAVEQALPEEERTKLASLPSAERSGVFREHLRGVLRSEGEDVRARMPAKLVETIEAEQPVRRPLRLDLILKQQRELGERDARRIGEALGVPDEELRGLAALDRPALEDRLLGWQRATIDRAVERLGPPPGLDTAGYEALRNTGHAEFFRRWRALDPPPAYDEPAERAPARPAPTVRERVQLLMRVRQLAEPSFEERLAATRLPEGERERALAARVEARVLDFIEEHGLFSPEELAELRAASGTAFPEVARRLASAQESSLRSGARRGGRSAPRGGGR